MSTKIPLFPLGTVLFPGLVLPLHIFEDRYRQLVRDLLAKPEPREFGVIAIRHGRETGVDGVSDLYEVGCTAEIRQVEELDDGRFALVTVGNQRFRLKGLDEPAPYLAADVDLLDDEVGDEAAAALAVKPVQKAFLDYLTALANQRQATFEVPELPDEPVLLSYLRRGRGRGGHAGQAAAARRARRGPSAGGRARTAPPGDPDAAGAAHHPGTGPAVLALQPELAGQAVDADAFDAASVTAASPASSWNVRLSCRYRVTSVSVCDR